MIIGLDYDGVIYNGPKMFQSLLPTIAHDHEVFILSTRDDITEDMKEHVLWLFNFQPRFECIGRDIRSGRKKFKADHIRTYHESVDLFFDDDIFEIKHLHDIGVSAIWVPPLKGTDSAMEYVVDRLFSSKFFSNFFTDKE